MEENRKLTQEELLEAEAFFNLATMLGKSLQAAIFQADHPEYDPEIGILNIKEPAEDSAEPEEPEEPETEAAQEPADKEADATIHSNEANIDTQIAQLIALYDPRLKELIGSCALYPMTSLAFRQFAYSLGDINGNLSPEDKRKAAIAWVIVKRVFAVRHPDETLRILSITDMIRGDVFLGPPPSRFRPMDSADEEMIIDTCGLFSDELKADPISQTIDAITDNLSLIPKSDKIFLPRSQIFRNMLHIAKSGEKEEYPVDRRGTKIQVMILGKDKEKVLGLSPLARSLQSTIGQLLQQFRSVPGNETLPLIVSTDKIYREFAGKDDSYNPSDSQRKEIEEAMAVLTETYISMDYSIQAERHHLDRREGFDPDKVRHRTPLIMADHISAFHKGSFVKDAYRIWQAPPVYEHAAISNQIDSVDRRLLSGYMKQRQKAGIDEITLRRYLLVEINRIKYNKRKTKSSASYTEKLTFDTISLQSGFNASSPKLWRTLKEKVDIFMQEQVEAGNIQACNPAFTKQKQTGIYISV